MKKSLLIFLIYILFTEYFFADVKLNIKKWISDDNQELEFINFTTVNFNDNCLESLGKQITNRGKVEITDWKKIEIYLALNNDGSLLCEIHIIPPDYYNKNMIIYSSSWVENYLYYWFLRNIGDINQKKSFMSLGFIIHLYYDFPRGEIKQYASLRKSGAVIFYDDIYLKANEYTAQGIRLTWPKPEYNEISHTWNSAYLYSYIVGDFEKIKDIPVPIGLDDSFKKDFDNIPILIKNKNWELFNSIIIKYDLNVENYLYFLLKNDVPLNVISTFSENSLKNANYQNLINDISSNIDILAFLYNYFDEQEIIILNEYLNENIDVYVLFCKALNKSFSLFEPEISEKHFINCSIDNIEYLSKDYDIEKIATFFSKMDKIKIEKILQKRNDVISNFLKFYYLDFDSVSTEKLSTYIEQLKCKKEDFYTKKIYGIDKTIVERLFDNKYSNIFNKLINDNVLKININNCEIIEITTNNESKGIEFSDYKKSIVLNQIIEDTFFELAYKLYTNEIIIEDILFPNEFIINNCKVSITIDGGIKEFKKKNYLFIFGEYKNGKLIQKNLSITNSKKETLLFYAIKNNNVSFAKQLLKQGIDKDSKDTIGRTALDIAIEYKNIKIQKLIKDN